MAEQVKKIAKKTLPAPVNVQMELALEAVPDFMKGHAGEGLENLGTGDYQLPRVVLLQNTSPEVMANNKLRPGNFYHTLTEVDMGAELQAALIYVDKRYVLWNPLDQGGGILARADDGVHWVPASATFPVKINKGSKVVNWKTANTVNESRLAEWGTYDPDDPKSQPAATQVYTCVFAFPDFPGLSPSVILMQRSAIKPARNMLGKLKISRAPSFGMIFSVKSIVDNGPSGPFYNYQFTAGGFIKDEALFNIYREMHDSFKSRGVQIRDLETAQEEEPAKPSKDIGAEEVPL